MAKIVLCLALAVTMVVAAQARWIPDADAFAAVKEETYTQPGRLVTSESYGSTDVVQGDTYQSMPYHYDRMQEETPAMTNSFSDAFATEAYSNSFPTDNSFSTETNYVNPSQGVSYNYAVHRPNPDYDQGLSVRSAGTGATGGEPGKAASFTLEGNTEKTESVEWTESSDP